MKKLSLILAIVVATATTAIAASIESLIIQQNDGTMHTFNLYGEEEDYNVPITITFENGNLIASQNGQQTTLELISLSKMFFGATTSILTISDGSETADVFDMQGRRVATKMHLKDLQNRLPKGIYLVKNGGKTVKMTIK